MSAGAISYVVGSVFGIVAIFALFLNITVLLAMVKGKLFSNRHSPVYILSSQTIIVDSLLATCHLLYQCPSTMLQSYLFPASVQPTLLIILNAIFMFCWYHNSLSHTLVALNRLFVIVFPRLPVFTRQTTIAICVVQHLVALSLSATAQLLLPCCDFTYSWVVFSYQYNSKPDIPNYSNEYIDLPLNASSSLISMISYSVVIAKMHYARLQTAGIEQAGSKLLHKEYKYAIQFATMATVYTLTWIFFRACPFLIGNTSHLYLYGVVTVLAELNLLTNSTVYLVNNNEIKKSVRQIRGLEKTVSQVTKSNAT
ncbi:hypothetical protein PENTCL1PPCAC_15312, partial [Pristionchus entomophagus]